jgi:hypothetical protein
LDGWLIVYIDWALEFVALGACHMYKKKSCIVFEKVVYKCIFYTFGFFLKYLYTTMLGHAFMYTCEKLNHHKNYLIWNCWIFEFSQLSLSYVKFLLIDNEKNLIYF